MAFTVIRLVDKNKITEKGPVGFSWTTLFFGFFVPLTRNDGIYALIMLGASIITLGIAQLIFPFIYNKIFIQSLVKKGFKAKSYEPIYKDSKRLNVKKEKAMIREEAGFGAEGIVAKTFKEKSTKEEKEEIPGGHITKIIGDNPKVYEFPENSFLRVMLFVFLLAVLFPLTWDLDIFNYTYEVCRKTAFVDGKWIDHDPCKNYTRESTHGWYFWLILISALIPSHYICKIFFDEHSKKRKKK